MSISKVLEDKNLSDEEKLEVVAEIILKVRKVYGNTEKIIPVVFVDTAQGVTAFTHLSQASKVTCLRGKLAQIRTTVSETLANIPGTVSSRVEEGLLATDGMFTNITTNTSTEYL